MCLSLIWPVCMTAHLVGFLFFMMDNLTKWLSSASKYRIQCPSCDDEPEAEGIGGRTAVCKSCHGKGSIVVNGEYLKAHGLMKDRERKDFVLGLYSYDDDDEG